MEELLFWLAGGFADRSVSFLPFLVVITGCTWITAAYHQAGLDLLLSGERQAQSLGLPVKKMQFYLLCASALLAGLCVALSGPVAFVGLIAPHLARWLGAKLHKQLLLLAPLCGAILCVVADILARFMIAPAETPISAMIAIVGSPLLVVLIHRSIRENKI
jgi:iron complex transport system permease protein